MNFSSKTKDTQAFLDSLPSKTRVYVAAWIAGEDLSAFVPKSTLLRQAKIVLAYGVDITKPYDKSTNLFRLVYYLTSHELAVRLGVSLSTIYRWAYRGRVPFLKDSRNRLFFKIPLKVSPPVRGYSKFTGLESS
ncbi:MAG: helix-turn-helix domain-containing protein [Nitrosomonas sp. PRO4]|nr:helix-turn-helix domain-containing protein [Nitrosomonas sp. PRO4]